MTRESTIRTAANLAAHAYRAPMTDAVLAAATTAFVDWACVAVAGADGVMVRALRPTTAGVPGPCTVIGGTRSTDLLAALVNGTAAHTVELDDIYASGLFHPGAPVIAAALAIAQSQRASGADLLRAIVIGYEIGDRVAQALGPTHYRYFHTTGTAGTLGAAAAAACLLGLGPDGISAALSISATMAAGLQQTFRSSAVAKPLHAGHAAHAGVLAARAAQGGADGADDILEGDSGLGRAMADDPSWNSLTDPFGPDFLITQTTTKPYPCCGHTFAAIDAALELVSAGVRAADVRRIDVRTYQAATDVAGIARPTTPTEAKFSIAFTVASALVHGHVDLDSFRPEALADTSISALLACISVVTDETLTAASPARRGAQVIVTTSDGRTLERTVPDRFGSPANPMSAEQLQRKFALLLGDRAHLLSALSAVRTMDDVHDLPL